MITLVLGIALIWAIWKIVVLGLKMTWGLTKFVFSVVLFPLVVIGFFVAGLAYVAIPVAIVVGLIALFSGNTTAA